MESGLARQKRSFERADYGSGSTTKDDALVDGVDTADDDVAAVTFSAVLLDIGPWNQGSRARSAACARADNGSGSTAGEDALVDEVEAAEDDVIGAAVNGSGIKK